MLEESGLRFIRLLGEISVGESVFRFMLGFES